MLDLCSSSFRCCLLTAFWFHVIFIIQIIEKLESDCTKFDVICAKFVLWRREATNYATDCHM